MKTVSLTKPELTWHLLDAEGMALGRLATAAATLLRGKQKPQFVNNLDCGDHVVVINTAKIVLTGNKLEDKEYHHYSGFPGGLKSITAKELLATRPEDLTRRAVKGMLPKNKLQGEWMKRLHLYAGHEHPHQANLAHSKSK